MHASRLFLLGCLVLVGSAAARAEITNLSQWTLVEDPPHPGFTASVDAASATLFAGNVAIPSATDIGFQSINGNTAATSNSGFAFDPASDFMIAVDYSLSFSNSPIGGLALGFGIGEDGDGANSAGVTIVTDNGSPLSTFAANARVNDVTQLPMALGRTASPLDGTLFVSYRAADGNITVGAADGFSAASPELDATFSRIQNEWTDAPLIASFFIRSQPVFGSSWQGGNAEAAFSNFRVLSGTPVAIPEPSTTGVLSLAALGFCLPRRRRINKRIGVRR